MIVVVILMGTVYAGIMYNMQKRLFDLPQVMVRQLISKESESVSDYALRTAVRNSVSLGLQAQAGQILKMTTIYSGFNVGNCVIDSIVYTFVEAANHYRALSYVRGSLQEVDISYPAEIAFNFPISQIVGNPNCFYLEMDQPQFNPSFNEVIDSSDNENHAEFFGDVTTRPMGEGVNGWKCASFGSGGGWIQHEGNASMQVNSNYTIVAFAKIQENHPAATLVWLPSNPYDTGTAIDGHPGQNLRYKPTGGIWYQSGNMHFTAVNTNYTQVTVTVPFTPDGKWPHNKDKWHFFAMTYNYGIVKAYINGTLRGISLLGFPFAAITNTYGFTLGRKDIRNLGAGGTSEYMYMLGLMDQTGLYNRTLTDAEILNFYNGVINPADILYIRD